jgi:hypothetical protein
VTILFLPETRSVSEARCDSFVRRNEEYETWSVRMFDLSRFHIYSYIHILIKDETEADSDPLFVCFLSHNEDNGKRRLHLFLRGVVFLLFLYLLLVLHFFLVLVLVFVLVIVLFLFLLVLFLVLVLVLVLFLFLFCSLLLIIVVLLCKSEIDLSLSQRSVIYRIITPASSPFLTNISEETASNLDDTTVNTLILFISYKFTSSL